MCIIARTHMPKQEDVEYVVKEYLTRPGYLLGLDQDECLHIGVELWRTGRVIEPRSNGIHAMSVPQEYIWMDLFPTAVDGKQNEAVQAAWDAYRMLISLTEQLPEMDGAQAAYNPMKHNINNINPKILNGLIV